MIRTCGTRKIATARSCAGLLRGDSVMRGLRPSFQADVEVRAS